MPHSEIIIEIAGEGGSITLLGARTAQGWRFSRSTNESIDEAFARETWFGRRNIPGLLTASLVRQGGQLAHKTYARYRAARPAPSVSTT